MVSECPGFPVPGLCCLCWCLNVQDFRCPVLGVIVGVVVGGVSHGVTTCVTDGILHGAPHSVHTWCQHSVSTHGV